MVIDTKKFKIKKMVLNDKGIKQFLLDAPESIGVFNIENIETKVTPSGNKCCITTYESQDFICWFEMKYFNNILSIELCIPSKLLQFTQVDYKKLDASLLKQENYLYNATQEMLKKLNAGLLTATPDFAADFLPCFSS